MFLTTFKSETQLSKKNMRIKQKALMEPDLASEVIQLLNYYTIYDKIKWSSQLRNTYGVVLCDDGDNVGSATLSLDDKTVAITVQPKGTKKIDQRKVKWIFLKDDQFDILLDNVKRSMRPSEHCVEWFNDMYKRVF